MPITITNPYRLRLECLRNVSPGCADLAGRIVVALRTEDMTLSTATLIEDLFDHLDAVGLHMNGSVDRLGLWMYCLVEAKALQRTDVETFLSDAATLSGPSSAGLA